MCVPGPVCAAMAILLAASGCSQTLPDRAERMTRGYIFYLDGAGGGSAFSNYSAGVKQGMLDAGYDGAGEVFEWQTGLGMVADQRSSVEHKRSKAAECSRRVQQYAREHPDARVTLMGLSAGTAVAVFALEALPREFQVENVVLLSASLAADYDLTPALCHVRGRMYVTTSEKDGMLAYLVPLAGTADRQPGTVPSAGLSGFQIPVHASRETREQYAKLVYIRWAPEFAHLGDRGGHFDAVSARFVQVCIAPLIMRGSSGVSSSPAATGERVRNPDYARWSRFPCGSWVMLEGRQRIGATEEAVRVKATLISKQPDMLIVEREYFLDSSPPRRPVRIQGFFVSARINPADHPFSAPEAQLAEMPSETIGVADKMLRCRVRSVQVTGEFPEYGRGVSATVSENEAVPGGMVRIWLKSSKGDHPFEFRAVATAYETRSGAASH